MIYQENIHYPALGMWLASLWVEPWKPSPVPSPSLSIY